MAFSRHKSVLIFSKLELITCEHGERIRVEIAGIPDLMRREINVFVSYVYLSGLSHQMLVKKNLAMLAGWWTIGAWSCRRPATPSTRPRSSEVRSCMSLLEKLIFRTLH